MAEPSDPGTRTCPWCSASANATDTKCPECGAALAQREDLGGVVIPGLTGVDPNLSAWDAQPLHLKGPSPTQGLATGILPAAAMGGPAGLAILGGIAAVGAVEYLSAKGPGGQSVDPATVGIPSEVARMAVEKLEREGEAGDGEAVEES
jgi:hypothetical protein